MIERFFESTIQLKVCDKFDCYPVIDVSFKGMIMDLIECVFGRTFNYPTFPAIDAHQHIVEALLSPDYHRVVVVAHSQGCLIAEEVLRYISRDLERIRQSDPAKENEILERMKKLEVFLFASPAANVIAPTEVHIEYFANQYDLVAEIGMINPRKNELQPLAADDNWVFINRTRNGHILNEHYLRGFDFDQESNLMSESFPYVPLNDHNNRSRLEIRHHQEM